MQLQNQNAGKHSWTTCKWCTCQKRVGVLLQSVTYQGPPTDDGAMEKSCWKRTTDEIANSSRRCRGRELACWCSLISFFFPLHFQAFSWFMSCFLFSPQARSVSLQAQNVFLQARNVFPHFFLTSFYGCESGVSFSFGSKRSRQGFLKEVPSSPSPNSALLFITPLESQAQGPFLFTRHE